MAPPSIREGLDAGGRPGEGLGFAAAMEMPPADVAEVLGPDAAVGLKVCALHERGYAGDIIDIASVRHLYAFRELESLAKVHHDEFSLDELASRLEAVDSMDDEEFERHGLGVRIKEIRCFALAWLEDIKSRRVDDGDADYDDPDLPEVD